MRRTIQTARAMTLAWASLALAGGAANGQETEKKDDKQPATVAVEQGPFRVKVDLEGVFEAETTTPLRLRPEAWSEFTVVEAVSHGERVRKGDVLVRFDPEKLDRALADAETNRKLGHLALAQAEAELSLAEKSAPFELEAARIAHESATTDLQLFLEKDRPRSEESARFSVEQSHNYLSYAQEELNQLEKMYSADDLSEETEEIILERQRNTVKSARYSLERSEQSLERLLDVGLPRQERSHRRDAEGTALALERAQASLPASLEQKRLALAKLKHEQHKSDENLAKLHADRALMEVEAPADGVVYYGKFTGGAWSGGAAAREQLQPHGGVPAHGVFMTIVAPRPIVTRATIDEKKLHRVRRGQSAVVAAVGYPDQRFEAEVAEVASIPLPDGTFDARLAVELGADADFVAAGMKCSIELLAYQADEALSLPAKSVFEDDDQSGAWYVFVQPDEGPHERRDVKVGQRTDEKVEILDGLSEGDRVLKEKPKDENEADE